MGGCLKTVSTGGDWSKVVRLQQSTGKNYYEEIGSLSSKYITNFATRRIKYSNARLLNNDHNHTKGNVSSNFQRLPSSIRQHIHNENHHVSTVTSFIPYPKNTTSTTPNGYQQSNPTHPSPLHILLQPSPYTPPTSPLTLTTCPTLKTNPHNHQSIKTPPYKPTTSSLLTLIGTSRTTSFWPTTTCILSNTRIDIHTPFEKAT